MAAVQFRILCIGDDIKLLEGRCAVLASQGHDAVLATTSTAFQQLRTSTLDLVIASERFARQHGSDFCSAIPAGTCTLVLQGLTMPRQLIAAVAECARQRRVNVAACSLANCQDALIS